MADSSIRTLFGMAATAAYTRASSQFYGDSLKGVCLGMAKGFGLGEYEGMQMYNYFKGLPGLTSTKMTTYMLYETETAAYIDAFFPTMDPMKRLILTISAHAVIFSAYMNSAVPLEDVSLYVGKVMANVGFEVNGYDPFQRTTDKPPVIIQPITADVVERLVALDYSIVIAEIGESEDIISAPMVNYNWYDVNDILAGPNLQTMKDVENQYYAISGVMEYRSLLGDMPNCYEETVQIFTHTGYANQTFIRNVPCKESGSYIGPPDGTFFNRLFNDGPPSSGIFTPAIKQAYIDFDKSVLSGYNWKNNAAILYHFTTGSDGEYIKDYNGTVFVDSDGRYSLDKEWETTPTGVSQCADILVNMHVGDNEPKLYPILFEGACIGTETLNVTGWKFVSLELAPDYNLRNPLFFRGNPRDTTGNIYKRMLNIDENPYLATLEDGVFKPYYYVDVTRYDYIGGPQLNGSGSYPTLAFWHTLDNPTFGTFPSIHLYPCISRAGGSTTNLGNSSRTYSISTGILIEASKSSHVDYEHTPTVPFTKTISSNLSGKDEIYAQFFGMGDAFSGAYDILAESRENAGFFYTGFVMSGQGGLVDVGDLTGAYADDILGSPVKEFMYYSGYNTIPYGHVCVVPMYAQDASGNLVTYYYFDTGNAIFQSLPALPSLPWSNFAPLPDAWDSAGYTKLSGITHVENYLPRFSHGPFAIETRKILYPNALSAVNTYNGKSRGLPTQVTFDLEIREEAVREIYATFTINAQGIVSTAPAYIPVLRAGQDEYQSPYGGAIVTGVRMSKIFTPDDSRYSNTYDFNRWLASGERDFLYYGNFPYVDLNWAPMFYRSGFYKESEGYYIPSGKNNFYHTDWYWDGWRIPEEFGWYYMGFGERYYCGIRQTGCGYINHLGFTGEGPSDGGDPDKEGDYIAHTEAPLPMGLYHTYRSVTRPVTLFYAPPIFNLATRQIEISEGLRSGFAGVDPEGGGYEYSWGWNWSEYRKFDRTTGIFSSGMDPFFMELMGGRRGGITAEIEGGYHNHGFIGDRWVGTIPGYNDTWTNGIGFGIANFPWTYGNNSSYPHFIRYPLVDNRYVVFNMTNTGTDVWLNGMAFAPYNAPANNYKPYTASKNLTCVYSGQTTTLTTQYVGTGFLTFDVGQFFPVQPYTGQSGWYIPSGVTIGPFDRDVELGLLEPETLFAYTDLYINGKQITHYQQMIRSWTNLSEPEDYFNVIYNNSGIEWTNPNYSYGRADGRRKDKYTVLAIIPSGETANINIDYVERVWEGTEGNNNPTGIGMKKSPTVTSGLYGLTTGWHNTKLALRSYQPRYDYNWSYSDDNNEKIRLGEGKLQDPLRLSDNKKEILWTIPHNGLENFQGTWTRVNFSESGICFATPSISGFRDHEVTGQYGNMYYESDYNVLKYWRDWAVQNNTPVLLTGWREGSRMSLTIKRLNLNYDVIPYQAYQIVAPSGDCVISGAMTYHSQADNSIFAEGIYLSGMAVDDLDEIYNPVYVSEVLDLVPFFTRPTGTPNSPVYLAPSVMRQRRFPSIIERDQQYNYLMSEAPYNYNKLLWPALSDLETLNPGETLEKIPPDDGETFVASTVLFSASQGQDLPNGDKNPNIDKLYGVVEQYQTYNSISTDSLLNSGTCVTSRRGTKNALSQSNLNGALTTQGTPLMLVKHGLI